MSPQQVGSDIREQLPEYATIPTEDLRYTNPLELEMHPRKVCCIALVGMGIKPMAILEDYGPDELNLKGVEYLHLNGSRGPYQIAYSSKDVLKVLVDEGIVHSETALEDVGKHLQEIMSNNQDEDSKRLLGALLGYSPCSFNAFVNLSKTLDGLPFMSDAYEFIPENQEDIGDSCLHRVSNCRLPISERRKALDELSDMIRPEAGEGFCCDLKARFEFELQYKTFGIVGAAWIDHVNSKDSLRQEKKMQKALKRADLPYQAPVR